MRIFLSDLPHTVNDRERFIYASDQSFVEGAASLACVDARFCVCQQQHSFRLSRTDRQSIKENKRTSPSVHRAPVPIASEISTIEFTHFNSALFMLYSIVRWRTMHSVSFLLKGAKRKGKIKGLIE